MPKYLYEFGYTTPERPKGTDFEDSREFFIVAENEAEALAFGKQLSDVYIARLRQQTEDIRVSKSSDWVVSEEALRLHGRLDRYAETPMVQIGESVPRDFLFEKETRDSHEDFGEKKR